MSRLIATVLIVCSLAALASQAELVRTRTNAPAERRWVRTVDGWEPRHAVVVAQRSAPPALHPGVVAGFLAAVSVTALVAFPGPPSDDPH